MKLSTKRVAQLAVMVAVLVVGAYVSVPFRPIPITFQDMFVVLISLLFGSTAPIAILAYLLLGLVGLPVFAGGASGVVALLGPTGGFLVGFLLVATAVGALVEHWHWRSHVRDLLLAFAALPLMYMPGTFWMLHVLDLQGMSSRAAVIGLIPVLLADIPKMAVAGLLAPSLREAMNEA